jgi:hypothetical protein
LSTSQDVFRCPTSLVAQRFLLFAKSQFEPRKSRVSRQRVVGCVVGIRGCVVG